MESILNRGELSQDEDLKSRLLNFEVNLNEVEKIVDTFCSLDVYDKLEPEDKVRYDLFQAFAVNSLFWFYLRIKGIDPSQHALKSEINRVRDYMIRSKKLYDRQHLMPRIDKDAAKRFIKHELWTPSTSTEKNTENRESWD